MTRQDIYRTLRQCKWQKKDKTMHHYVIKMQSIARRVDIDDHVSNVNLLLGARTVDTKKKTKRYFGQYEYVIQINCSCGIGSFFSQLCKRDRETANSKSVSWTYFACMKSRN